MAKKKSTLTTIGMLLALIGGILQIVFGVMSILGSPFGGTEHLLGNLVGGIISILFGILLVFIYMDKINVGEGLVLGIVILVIGIVGAGGWLSLAGLGGILIVIDQFV